MPKVLVANRGESKFATSPLMTNTPEPQPLQSLFVSYVLQLNSDGTP